MLDILVNTFTAIADLIGFILGTSSTPTDTTPTA